MNLAMQTPKFESVQVINPDAPVYDPELWNDLSVDANDNVDEFFKELNASHYRITTSLQAASLLSLGNIVALADDISEYPYGNVNASRIKNLLPIDEVDTLKSLVRKYFSSQQTRANCYAYALDFKDGYAGSKPDPGGITKQYKKLYNDFTKAVIAGARQDGLIHAGNKLPPMKDGFYRVAVAIDDEKEGFHWLREGFGQANWSHKAGHGPVSDKDNNGVLITNPSQSNFGSYEVKAYFYVPRSGIVPMCLDAG